MGRIPNVFPSNGCFKAILGAAAFVVAFAATAGAGQGVWTTGGPYGGKVTALGVNPNDRSFALAATAIDDAGHLLTGVFASHDGGRTWSTLLFTESLGSVRCISIDPTDPETIYAGIDANNTSAYVAKSVDGGRTWSPSSFGPVTTFVPALVIDPSHPSTLYAATDQGAFKSLDSGATWSAKNVGLPDCSQNCGLDDLAIDPSNPQVLFTLSAGAVYKSTDGGQSWEPANAGLSGGSLLSLAIDPFDGRTLFVGGAAGIFKSTDEGQIWFLSLSASSMSISLPPGEIISITFDPSNPQHAVALSSTFEIFETFNTGVSWNNTAVLSGLLPGSVGFTSAGIAVDSLDGISLSSDESHSWLLSNQGILGINVAMVVADPFQPGEAYALDSLEGNLYRTFDGGKSWLPPDPDIQANLIVPDPSNRGVLYVAQGTFVSKSPDGGETWQAIGQVVAGDNRFGQAHVVELLVDPNSSEVLYALVSQYGSEFLYRTPDGGVTWNLAGGVPNSSLFSITIDLRIPTTLYAVVIPNSDEREFPIFKSTDAGTTWNPLFGLPGVFFDAITVAPSAPSTLYATSTIPDAGGGISVFQSTDSGTSWVPAGSNLPGTQSSPVIVSPLNPHEVFLSTFGGGPAAPGGVFRSRDGGMNWQDISGALPDKNVYSLALDSTGGSLDAATGAGVYEFTFGRPNLNIAPVPPSRPRPISRPGR